MAANFAARGSGKTEEFARQAVPGGGAHMWVSRGGENFRYRIPRHGRDICPTCNEGSLNPIGQTKEDIHLACTNGSCGQKVARRKFSDLDAFLSGE